MKSMIIGRGETGKAVAEVIAKRDEVVTYDLKDGAAPTVKGIDILHICFPFSDEDIFVPAVQYHIDKYKPVHVIVWSTVAIGTTRQIKGAVHSPVEGRHPNLTTSIQNMMRWLGTEHESEGRFFKEYFKECFIKTHLVPSSDFTEFLKLRSTARYGINIAFAEYEAGVAAHIGMDYQLLKDFDWDYNKLYRNLNMTWAQRYVLNNPEGKIGGHCVVPNARLLDRQYPSDFLKKIISMEDTDG